LFSAEFFEDPFLVQEVGLSLVGSAEEEEEEEGAMEEKRMFEVETFSKLLELVTVRHRLLESASETAHLAELRHRAGFKGIRVFEFYSRNIKVMSNTK